MATDYSSWKFTQKVIRIYHNRAVVRHFKSEKDNQPTNGKDAIKASVLIRAKDSALVVMNKQLLFQNIIKTESANSTPESWITKSIGADIPQLQIIYRAKGRSNSGSFSLCIPHFNGNKGISPPRYTKGNQPVVFNLKDRSKLVVNAVSESEGKSLINYFLRFVDPKFIPSNRENFILPAKTKIRKDTMNPIRGDFYPLGQGNNIPAWRIYF
jgi:hypothetical protein